MCERSNTAVSSFQLENMEKWVSSFQLENMGKMGESISLPPTRPPFFPGPSSLALSSF